MLLKCSFLSFPRALILPAFLITINKFRAKRNDMVQARLYTGNVLHSVFKLNLNKEKGSKMREGLGGGQRAREKMR